MRAQLRPVVGFALAAALAGCGHGASGFSPASLFQNPTSFAQASANHVRYGGTVVGNAAQVCGPVAPGYARCHAWVRLDIPMLAANAGPDAIFGYHPSDLQSAYKLPSSTGGKGQTIAVVDAYDDPNAEADIAVYRSEFGLSACGSKNKCFQKVNEQGKTSPLPGTDPSGEWELEESLDVDMVSAACPNCKIILVEATSNSFADLAKSVDSAAKLGADAISNSYGGGESGGFGQDKHYDHPGHMVLASN